MPTVEFTINFEPLAKAGTIPHPESDIPAPLPDERREFSFASSPSFDNIPAHMKQILPCLVGLSLLAACGGDSSAPSAPLTAAEKEAVAAIDNSVNYLQDSNAPPPAPLKAAAGGGVAVVGVAETDPFVKRLQSTDPEEQLDALNELLDGWEQTSERPFTALSDFVKAGLISHLPNPPAGTQFVYDKRTRRIVLGR